MTGLEQLDKVISVDQSPIGRTPRSNPATYIGLFDLIRELFTQTPESRARGYKPGRFSFNVKGGRCEVCQGDGQIKIEMHFLPDVYVPCEQCHGKRYNRETLDIRFKGKNIADVLEMPVEEALEFFAHIPKIARRLQTLHDVGLDYMRLGQPATTLSGGEAQRIKLASELSKIATGTTLYILDEPTTGLHFADIEKLLEVLQRLVDSGNSVVVIEHNLDVIKTADRIIDMGPEGGEEGGVLVATGTPEQVAAVEDPTRAASCASPSRPLPARRAAERAASASPSLPDCRQVRRGSAASAGAATANDEYEPHMGASFIIGDSGQPDPPSRCQMATSCGSTGNDGRCAQDPRDPDDPAGDGEHRQRGILGERRARRPDPGGADRDQRELHRRHDVRVDGDRDLLLRHCRPGASAAARGASDVHLRERGRRSRPQARPAVHLARPAGFTSPGVPGNVFPYGQVQIIDVSDPKALHEITSFTLPAGHTTTCVNACDVLWTAGPGANPVSNPGLNGRPIYATDATDRWRLKLCPEPIDDRSGTTARAATSTTSRSMRAAWPGSVGRAACAATGAAVAPTGGRRRATGCDPVPFAGGGTPEVATPSRFMHNSFRHWRPSSSRAKRRIRRRGGVPPKRGPARDRGEHRLGLRDVCLPRRLRPPARDASGAGLADPELRWSRSTPGPRKPPRGRWVRQRALLHDRRDGLTANAFFGEGVRFWTPATRATSARWATSSTAAATPGPHISTMVPCT